MANQDNKTFEADAVSVNSLRLQIRQKDNLGSDEQSTLVGAQRARRVGKGYTRETLLRLIDWIKDV